MGRIEVWGRLCGPILAAATCVGSIVLSGAEGEAETAMSMVSAEVISASGISGAAEAGPGTRANDGATAGISTGGAVSAAGGIVLIAGSGAEAASFNVTGEPDASYAISLPPTVSVAHAAGDAMTVNVSTDGALRIGMLEAGGKGTFTVEASLEGGASQVTGVYSGTFEIAIEYQ